MNNRNCTRCGKEYHAKIKKSGYPSYYCSECSTFFHKRWKENNLEKNRAYDKEYNKNNAERRKDRAYKRLYNISLKEHDLLLKEQNKRCLICDKEQGLHVDHCHKTGIVRGLLCALCNKGLGLFKDDAALLQNAIKYLQRSYE